MLRRPYVRSASALRAKPRAALVVRIRHCAPSTGAYAACLSTTWCRHAVVSIVPRAACGPHKRVPVRQRTAQRASHRSLHSHPSRAAAVVRLLGHLDHRVDVVESRLCTLHRSRSSPNPTTRPLSTDTRYRAAWDTVPQELRRRHATRTAAPARSHRVANSAARLGGDGQARGRETGTCRRRLL
jgi:hypothetical protein